MKWKYIAFFLIIITLLSDGINKSIYPQQKTAEFPVLTGKYLGQKPPGMTPEVFAKGIVSTQDHEYGICFSPDGKEIFFTRMKKKERVQKIMYIYEDEDGWREPIVAPFSGQYSDMEPCISPDGIKVYFVSFRPVPGSDEMTADIWMSEKRNKKWDQAKHLGPPFNPGKSLYFSFTHEGTVYTTDAEKRGGILKARLINGKYSDFEKLSAPINTGSEAHPYVAPDESYLIFDSFAGNEGPGLYVSFRNDMNEWSQPVSMKRYTGEGGVAMVSPDGKYLFYTNKGDIYWVDAKIIEKLKPQGIKQ
ncbi:MAG: hypothetical protein OEZ30_00955 [Candidatus Aminicenantes bacterium]|nr:hypothetical protein [Candidatus Aminicenantes bacterium]MDH5714116.1 hypothetical protein [Candidatus Aminicenantes bacterium]